MTRGALLIGRIVQTAVAAGASEAEVDDAGRTAVQREAVASDRALTELWNTREPSLLRSRLVEAADAHGARCARAAADERLAGLVVVPAGHDLVAAKAAFVENMMQPANLSAWLPTRTAAMGEMVRSLGACSPRLDKAHVDRALRTVIGDGRTAPNPTAEQRHFMAAFDAGLAAGKATPPAEEVCAELARVIRPGG